jgi:glycosyl hydrolase family 114
MGLVDGDTALSQDLVVDFDWTVVWSCLATQCVAASPFMKAGKAAYLVEYGDASRATVVCPAAKGLGLSAIIKNQSLDAFRAGCP